MYPESASQHILLYTVLTLFKIHNSVSNNVYSRPYPLSIIRYAVLYSVLTLSRIRKSAHNIICNADIFQNS